MRAQKSKALAAPLRAASAIQNTNPAIVPQQIEACNNRRPKLPPRQARALSALLPGAWVSREAFDRIVGASNGPDVVWKLRAKLGRDAIDMRLEDATDRDGRPCRPGSYRLTAEGRARMVELGLSAGYIGEAAQ